MGIDDSEFSSDLRNSKYLKELDHAGLIVMGQGYSF